MLFENQHPEYVLRAPPAHCHLKCPCKTCLWYLCEDCGQWHLPGHCNQNVALPPGYRICPNCKHIVEKTAACNHISCACGKHFCYYCGAGPWNDGHDCYSHMSNEHSGCFNNPPDYRKYCLKENVSDQELQAFYQHYPKFRPTV